MALHDVAIGAGGRVVGHVRGPLTISECETAQTGENPQHKNDRKPYYSEVYKFHPALFYRLETKRNLHCSMPQSR